MIILKFKDNCCKGEIDVSSDDDEGLPRRVELKRPKHEN